ncbi:periplasmic component of the Tol biopolymer transport system [Terriglobus roseus DSM 18391]|uniref:Periplasmic component of the Tol biopolymer transport system n=1 Tax=Terriglobus roseus (strain DSM 18391 / NRRL B-41598 / KBS 63) TaxID=926566 RepID=I3ZE05_TERRK|nr:PD40 domain-containing protein [Terriglobus roseus]AFL87473.1 periplasmic component of the Tol biopolymer transport system [Terriglobus roseus DSM 18391]
MVTTTDLAPEVPTTRGHVTDPVLLENCLQRIQSSAEFVRSDRMVRFLRVVVQHASESRDGRLTERSIGCEVFDRPLDWDPSIDTIVRSEARRLRTKLEQYYERQGGLDPIRISMPKGGYTAEFQLMSPPVSAPEDRTAVSSKPQRSLVFMTAALASVVTALLIWFFHRQQSNDSEARFEVQSISSEMGQEYSPALSPDGNTIAYVWDDRQSGPDIFLRAWKESAPRRLNVTPAIRLYPSWSHDGASLAYLVVEGEEVFVTIRLLNGGPERRIAQMKRQVGSWSDDPSPLLGPAGPVWTPDGSLIFADYDPATATSSLVRTTVDGQRSVTLSSHGVEHYLYPRVSPDGRALAYVRYTSHGVGELFILPTGRDPRQLTSDARTIQGLNWSPDGKSLLFSSNRRNAFQLWTIPSSGGTPSPVQTNSTFATDPVFDRKGDILFVDSRENWNIWRRSITGSPGTEQRLIASSGRNYDPRYSPNGQRIAFASDRSGTMQLWTAMADGSAPQQLTHLAGSWLGGIAWSPDGSQIAFDARPNQRSAIYIISATGGEPKILETNSYEERMPAWSVDGKTLYFNSNRDSSLAIWRRELSTETLQRVTASGMFAVTAAEDGIFFSSRTGILWKSDADGSHAQALMPELQAEPVMSWFADRGTLYLTNKDKTGRPILRTWSASQGSIDRGALEGHLVPNAPDIAVSPDGRWLLFAERDLAESDLKLRKLQR